MADTASGDALALPVDGQLLARLRGVACITCGSTDGPLAPAGHRYTTTCLGGRLGWAVVACPAHTEAAA
ncbi:hypothetical protein [Streptacidiphilus cavernicola]|uniref:Uncharacterized protein n=1 Tax=Streptacidiphilus cavernicola TaxID=3342716 RepID=A0ABV6VS34_9ACTN